MGKTRQTPRTVCFRWRAWTAWVLDQAQNPSRKAGSTAAPLSDTETHPSSTRMHLESNTDGSARTCVESGQFRRRIRRVSNVLRHGRSQRRRYVQAAGDPMHDEVAVRSRSVSDIFFRGPGLLCSGAVHRERVPPGAGHRDARRLGALWPGVCPRSRSRTTGRRGSGARASAPTPATHSRATRSSCCPTAPHWCSAAPLAATGLHGIDRTSCWGRVRRVSATFRSQSEDVIFFDGVIHSRATACGCKRSVAPGWRHRSCASLVSCLNVGCPAPWLGHCPCQNDHQAVPVPGSFSDLGDRAVEIGVNRESAGADARSIPARSKRYTGHG